MTGKIKCSTLILISMLTIISYSLSGCSGSSPKQDAAPDTSVSSETNETAGESVDAPAVVTEEITDTPVIILNEGSDTSANITDESSDTSEDITDESSDTSEDSQDENKNDESSFTGVVWLGDSLTQGSLGDDNFNKDNPQAPWRRLADMSGWDVDGYGYFGYNTGAILWKFGEDGGEKDPSKIYVFWVGSNDFAYSVDTIPGVIGQIDGFNEKGGIDKYLVLGTTNRGDMDPTAYIGINKEFSDRYGEKYLDIMPYVEYGDDGIHLTESSYNAVAEAVYDKLKSLYCN